MASIPAPILVDRADVHKSCKSLEAIVYILANYTEAANAMAAVQKKLAKALKEAASVKGTNNVPANAMVTSAGIFEALAEVDAKFAKIADKEAENVGSDLKKWFKKLTKEEKAHDERITNANARIKQAGQAYEKKAKKKDRDAADEHSRYVAILSSVGPEMSQDKHNHCLFVTQRHTTTLSGFAASLSRLAEAEWTRACENVRRSAPSIGSVGEWRALCEGGWSGPVPGDLPDLGTADYERDRRSNDGMDKSVDAMRTLMLPQPTGAATTYANEYPESPTSPFNPRLPLSTGRSSEGHSVAEHSSSNTMPSRPPSPSTTQVVPNTLKKKSAYSDSGHGPSLPTPMTQPVTQGRSTSGTSSASSPLNIGSAVASSAPSISPVLTEDTNPPRAANDDRDVASQDRRPPADEAEDPEGTTKPETKAKHPPPSQDLPPFSSRDSFAGERNQAIARKVDFVDDRERERKISAPSPVNAKPSGSGRNVNVAGNLDRRLSVESTMSNNSLVATMRDRYDTRPVKPSSPPPRDLPRLAQSVTNLATRYTPIDAPTSPPRSTGAPSAQSGTSADRFPTFQDRHPRPPVDRSDRDRDQYRALPESPAPERDYFGDGDKERYRYSESPTVDRNRFLRDDRDRERYRTARPRSPDRQYPDEFGTRDRQRRIDTVEELALQEREENLREQERQLGLERARLANAREAGYTSDTGRSHRGGNPYGAPRRSESPGPMTSQQSLRPPQAAPPYDHSPSCGCQRCSAQHYASSTPSLPRTRRDSAAPEQPPIYKPDPPIMLRPEKPKNWIRRMSMPVTSLVSSNDKSPSASGQNWTNMTLPEDDARIMRRSFELERDREAAARFGGTTRR